MEEDGEGFRYPRVDEAKCIHCGRCAAVCAFQKTAEDKEKTCFPFRGVYAVKHRDGAIRMKSRSGGIFTAVTDLALREGGTVYGAAFRGEGSLEVVHKRADSPAGRDAMRGSRYVQSRTDSSLYAQVKADLQQGKKVVFSGTSCQVAALRSYLGRDDENLFCIDIVCHGVPSPRVLRDYLAWQQGRLGEEIADIDFRNKKYGWAGHVETVTGKSGRQKDSFVYSQLFYQHRVLRPCCFVCPYKGLAHPGDLTIGDYWGIEHALPGFSDNRGVSLVLANTKKGQAILQRCVDNGSIECRATDIEKSMQPPLKKPFSRPADRDTFFREYDEHGFAWIVRKYAGDSWKGIVRYRVKKLLMDLHLYR